MARSATPEDFFTAALRLLAGPGLPALRIGRLCREVGVTSGSFYHHFGGWDGFVTALLAHWTREEVDRILELVRTEDDLDERPELLERLALTVPHEAERTIRRWAGTDEVVAAAQRHVDERRRDALREVLGPLIGDETLTATLADVGLSLLVGHQQLAERDEGPTPSSGAPLTASGAPPADLATLLDQYELLVRGHARRAFHVTATGPVSGSARSAATGSR